MFRVFITMVVLSTCAGPTLAQTPILFDTDIVTDIGDAFALGFIYGSQELSLKGITTVGGNTQQRAMAVCRFLTMSGRRHTLVAAGQDPQPDHPITKQYYYYYHPDALFNRTKKPETATAVEFLHSRLKAQPGEVTILATGPLTNIARLLTEKPDAAKLIKKIVLVESNLSFDEPASKAVQASKAPLLIVTKSAVRKLRLTADEARQVFRPGTALSRQVETLYQMWDEEEPPLADVLAAALCFRSDFATIEGQNVTAVDRAEFVKWYVDRMASLVAPERRPSQLVAQGNFPHRVHVAEDYDNDIERRWWMSGKAELKNLPPGSTRACRGVLTHDFDDLLMASRNMYSAVIFNPVPGPPMGKQTKLSFKYWLQGTDSIRVAIYSLTNGYHRHLVLKGLPQGKWQDATVDMRDARRPDGTGGPLAENERIDDIQFYIDPNAQILIDDIFLYDAAGPDEKRPFPKRVFFSGTFDSGKQGKEWPGTFDIAADEGFFWRGAKSVQNPDSAKPWLRIHLRGLRALGAKTLLDFRYKGSADEVQLVNAKAGQKWSIPFPPAGGNEWQKATLDFTKAIDASNPAADEIHFLLPAGGSLIIDDLLLYEP